MIQTWQLRPRDLVRVPGVDGEAKKRPAVWTVCLFLLRQSVRSRRVSLRN
jgi:hypothetical protein